MDNIQVTNHQKMTRMTLYLRKSSCVRAGTIVSRKVPARTRERCLIIPVITVISMRMAREQTVGMILITCSDDSKRLFR